MKDAHKLRVDVLFKPSKHHSNIKSKFYSMSKCPNMFYTENNIVRHKFQVERICSATDDV